MNKKIIYYLLASSLFLSLTGCFSYLDKSNKASSTLASESEIDASTFTGVASAVNKVTGILITWPAVSDATLVKAYKIYRVNGAKKTLLGTVANSLTSYMDGTVTWGAIYTYQVNAVDQNDLEDSNTKTVKSLSWAGISSITAGSRTSLKVNFNNLSTVVDEIRIYGQTSVGGTKTLLGKGLGTDTDIELTGLRTGFPYIISAQAYVSSLAKEDGNDVTFTGSTLTVGYDYDGANIPQWGNVMLVRAFGEAPGAQANPADSHKSPAVRQVELVFNAFSTQGSSAKYVITRVVQGNTMDSSTKVVCTNTTTAACVVCTDAVASSGTVTCRDTEIAAPPTKYRYSMSLVHTDTATSDRWVEALPTATADLEKVSVLVPVPPKNMVLVQRDAANYDMCQQMNKAADPMNHNRCTYTGIAAVPYNTGGNNPALTFDPGYYDFGYNLFVDRWEMGCNWTMASQNGMCGTRSSPGDAPTSGSCVGTTTPTSSQGKLGDVYYHLASGGNYCYRATGYNTSTGTTWTSLASTLPLTDGMTQVQGMVTNDPGYYDAAGTINTTMLGRRGKINIGVNVYNAASVCATQVDTNYGTKRLGRQRELVVYSGPALLTGELYAFPSFNSYLTVYNGTTSHQSVFGCDLYSSTPDTVPTTLTDLFDTTNYPQYKEMMKLSSQGTNSKSYMIGAKATIDCESRYGVQEPNGRKFQSDMAWYSGNTASPVVTTGLVSPLDNGNQDLLYTITGASTGYLIENTKFSSGLLAYSNTNYTAYVVPMGLPITATSYSSTYMSKAQVTGNGVLNPSWNATVTSTNDAGYRMLSSTGRYHSRFDYTPSSQAVNIGEIRCVLPAE